MSCLEEFNAGTTEFEDLIVIEATLSDETTFQTVLLTRTFKIDETQNQQEKESGANVQIVSGSTIYNFTETSPGNYTSNVQFRAELNTDYQLLVTTQNGREYQSEIAQLKSETSNIEDLYAVREVNENGFDGISIYLDSYDPTGNSRYYTFDFEETYRIIVPNDPPSDPNNPITQTQEERTCYNTVTSSGRLLTNTSLSSEDRLSRYLITFVPNEDLKLNNRYSILVRQYTNNRNHYNFQKQLSELSSAEIFSPVQPGFVKGNISSVNNSNERVLGYFEVASVRERRIFINRFDFFDFPNENFMFCLNTNLFPVLPRICYDCTVLGTRTKPDFWID